MELDSHADTCVIGRHGRVVDKFNRTVNVTGYNHKLSTTNNVDNITAALVYDDPSSGEAIILFVHQAVHIPTIDNNLLCPMQMCIHEVEVNDCPEFLHENPTDRTHSIVVKADSGEFIIPLSLRGVTSFFPTRYPSDHEIARCNRGEIQSFELTSASPDWTPSAPEFNEQETAQVNDFGRVRETGDTRRGRFISTLASDSVSHSLTQIAEDETQCAVVMLDVSPMLNDGHFIRELQGNVQVNATTT